MVERFYSIKHLSTAQLRKLYSTYQQQILMPVVLRYFALVCLFFTFVKSTTDNLTQITIIGAHK